MGCEEERMDQIANSLKSKEGETDTKLTVASTLIGTGGAILTTVYLDQENTGECIALGTGILGATLGVSILANKKKVTFYHERYHLK